MTDKTYLNQVKLDKFRTIQALAELKSLIELEHPLNWSIKRDIERRIELYEIDIKGFNERLGGK